MSDIQVTLASSNISVALAPVNLTVLFPVSVQDSAMVWLDSLDEASSDQEAIDTLGLSTGDWYLTSTDHESSPCGIPKKITA